MDSDVFTYARAVLALAFVVGLIVLLAVLLKKTGLDKRLIGNRPAVPRLDVMETLYLDPRRRLVLLKCDNKEHLLLLGASGDLLIESRSNEGKA